MYRKDITFEIIKALFFDHDMTLYIIFMIIFGIYVIPVRLFFFFFNDTATTEIYPFSLPDALPISARKDVLRTKREEFEAKRVAIVSGVAPNPFSRRLQSLRCPSVRLHHRASRREFY